MSNKDHSILKQPVQKVLTLPAAKALRNYQQQRPSEITSSKGPQKCLKVTDNVTFSRVTLGCWQVRKETVCCTTLEMLLEITGAAGNWCQGRRKCYFYIKFFYHVTLYFY